MRIANIGGHAFCGWIRLNTDTRPPTPAGKAGVYRVVQGPRTGFDTYAVDVFAQLSPGEVVDLQSIPTWDVMDFQLGPLPPNPIAFFGVPTIDDVPMQLVSVRPSGAHWEFELRCRLGLICVDLMLRWAPDCPAWMRGEMDITASNPALPQLQSASRPCRLGGTRGTVNVGRHLSVQLADGQRRSAPVTIVFPHLLRTQLDYSSAGAIANGAITSNGIARLLPGGNPKFPGDPLAWTRQHLPAAVERTEAHAWDAGPLGVTATSGATGSQEDQVFVGGEMMSPAGIGAELVRYHVALHQALRPCHHLEIDGTPLVIDRHPGLVIWDGRAHRRISSDTLGKTADLSPEEAHNWWGPDVEHFLINTLAAAARVTGSWSLQRQLEAMAKVYLLQWTVDPRLSTSQPYAARAIGWEGIAAVHLWHGLADRELAQAVRARWIDRLNRVLLPAFAASGPIWDVRLNDPRLGDGAWWMPWQAAVGAYGLDLAGEVFSQPHAREAALAAAQRILADAWMKIGDVWVSAPVLPVSSSDDVATDFGPARAYVHEDCGVPHPTGDSPPVFDGSFNLYGMCLAPAVVLRHNRDHVRANGIMGQLLAEAGGGHPWLPPEVC